jgi:uncharacterized coiled-coil DUF342 family protein
METQNLIFANLQKIREKQNLGAIEDAIIETKNNIEEKAIKFTDAINSIETFYSNLSSKLESLVSESTLLSNKMQDLYSLADEVETEISEAKSYGVTFSSSEFPNISNLTVFYDYVGEITDTAQMLNQVLDSTYRG